MVETQKKVEELKKTYLSWSLHDSDVRREGIKEGKLETAQNLIIKNKLALEDIADCTGLPIETVQQLAEQLKVTVLQ